MIRKLKTLSFFLFFIEILLFKILFAGLQRCIIDVFVFFEKYFTEYVFFYFYSYSNLVNIRFTIFFFSVFLFCLGFTFFFLLIFF